MKDNMIQDGLGGGVSLIPAAGGSLLAGSELRLPALIDRAGERTVRRFFEFFTVEHRNPNTRRAYGRAIGEFLSWCDERGFELDQVEPIVVAAYVEHLGLSRSIPTVKQHLAAIRMMFDYLVSGQVLRFNPAAAVRGPKYAVKEGKTPVLSEDEARRLLDSIDVSTTIGLRDRAILGVMTYSFARVGAVVRMQVKDYYVQGRRAWFRLHEKGSQFRKVPAHHKAADYVEAYIEAAGIAGDRSGVLFRTTGGKGRGLTSNALYSRDVLRMIKRRARNVGLPPEMCCHTFRATGITNYLTHGGTIETAAKIAGHESTRTTQLYDRTADPVTMDEIERIRI